MADRKESKVQRFQTLYAAFLLAGVTAFLAAGSLFGGSGQEAAENPVWRPLLHTRDHAVLQLGRDSVRNVYVTDERLLPYSVGYDESVIAASAQAVSDYAEAVGVPVYLLAVPTSAGIYGDLLPEAAPLVNEHAELDTLARQLSSSVVRIEAESWLSTEREQYIYYRTDPCWTSYGAFCVYRTAIRRLGANPLGYDHFIISHFSDDYYGRLVQESGYREVKPDLIDLFYSDSELPPKSVTALRPDGTEQLSSYYRQSLAKESGDPALVFATNSEAVLHIETENQNNRELLLITDRFGGNMTPFLLRHYHTVTAVNLELAQAQKTDWQALVHNGSTAYTQILVLCGADTLRSPDFSAAMQLTKQLLPYEDQPPEQDKGDPA